MNIHDQIYGDFEINESILIDLINCQTIQRLKGISQQGTPQEYFHRKIFSRYDHSVGVMLLLRKLDADLNTQIAGLLHDASHTAFSHLIDWVIGDPSTENFQDSIFVDFLQKSEIPSILNKNGISLEVVSNLESFSLLETEAPSLCADRIDYTLRELINTEDTKTVQILLEDITSKSNRIVFKTKNIAEFFGKHYTKLQSEYWGGNETKARYIILSEALKLALSKKYLTIEDFFKTDNYVLEKLIKINDEDINNALNKLRNGFKIKIVDKNNGIQLKKKFRSIDPEVLVNNKIIKLSEISEEYKHLLKSETEKAKTDVFVEII